MARQTKNAAIYDQDAEVYAARLTSSLAAPHSIEKDILWPAVDRFCGDVAGLRILDAGCGPGLRATDLATRGAKVVAADISSEMIRIARGSPHADVEYLVHDLTKPLPGQPFDLVVSELVINDLADYTAYVATVSRALRGGGRCVMTLNNPYSAVLRNKVPDYYRSGWTIEYQGLASVGVHAVYHHRTMAELVEAFSAHGLPITGMSDLRPLSDFFDEEFRSRYSRVPFLMLLELTKVPVVAD